MIVSKVKKLIIIAGGTGGHVFPGLTVANYMMHQGWQVSWIGTINGIESNLVPQHGISINFINIRGIRGKKFNVNLIAPIRIFYALCKALYIMRICKPDVVLGMGGYVSGPGCLAAWILGIPVVLHEQNSVPGLTNRILSIISSRILQAFPDTFSHAQLVGNPIRDTILSLPSPEIRFFNRSGMIRILIIGGSQGARVLNKIMPEVASRLDDNSFILLHQVGKGASKEVNKSYVKNGITFYKVVEFIHDIASAYAWADVIVCRSGALTVSEISVVGLPAIFVPFMHKDYQQYYNAQILEKIGAAKIIKQSLCTVDSICQILSSWNRTILLSLAKRARTLARLDATERIALEIISVEEFRSKYINNIKIY